MEGRIKILLIEDNPGDARLLQEMLAEAKRLPFDLELADRLSTGQEYLEANTVDIILLDLSLPDSHGLDTFAQVLAAVPQTPIVVLSGLDDEAMAVNAVRAGAQDYLVKGQVDSNLLARSINYAIERKQAEVRQAYYLQTEHVLRQISSRFVDVQDLDQALREALRDAAIVLRTDRAHLFRVFEDEGSFSGTHEWVAGGVTPQIEKLQALDTSAFPWWLESLRSNESIAFSDTSQIPEPDREHFEKLGILSTLAIPILVQGELYGFLSFEEINRRREWASEEIGFLRNSAEILGRALERVEAEWNLQQRNLELATLNAMSQALSGSLDLEDLLDEALSRTVQALGSTGGLIVLADPRSDEPVLFGHTGLPENLVTHLQTHGVKDTPCGRVYVQGETIEIEDVSHNAPADVHAFIQTNIRSFVGIPIVQKERVLGALCLVSKIPRSISEDDLTLLTAIGQQIGLAIENARLFEDVAREREIAQTLLDTAETLNQTLQLDRLLERVLDELQRVIPYEGASISLLHEQNTASQTPGAKQTSTAWVVAARGFERIPSRGFMWEELPHIQRVVQQHKPVIVPDVQLETNWRPPVEEMEPIRSWLCVPLISKEKTLGILMVNSHQPGTYDKEMGRLALAFAQQVAVAIDNARLYEQTRAQLREAVLLHGVTAALSSTLDTEQMLPYMARSLCEAINSSRAEIYQLDEKSGQITVVADYAATSHPTAEERAPATGQTHSLSDFQTAAETMSWGRPIQMSTGDPDIEPHAQATLKAHGAQAALFLPMATRGRRIGLAVMWEDEGARRFTSGEIALGQTLTHQAATALENALLFEETREQVRRTRLLLQSSEASASTLDSTEVLRRTAEAVAQATGADMTAVYLLDRETTTLTPATGHRVPPKWLETYQDVSIAIEEHLFVKEAWEKQKLIYTADAPDDPRLDEKTRQMFPAMSILLTPMSVREEIIGGLWAVWWEESHHFVEQELQLTEGIVRQAAVAMQNARLFEEVESARIELEHRAQALEEANDRLQELDRLKSQFLANMSHELRTPLNSVIGFSEVLRDGLLGDLTPQQKECAENILFSGEHLLALINDILDLSKIEAGRMSLDPVQFDVPAWIEKVRATVRPLFDNKMQVLETDIADDLPPLNADSFRLKQVMLNLLSNANKFTPEGGSVTLTCTMADANTMLFAVTDTGIGIKPENQEIIFEEFRQAGNTAEKVKGTGLGLTISKKLVEMHGGRIWVDSEYEQGATFSVLLPIAGPPSLEPDEDETASAEKKQVLILESDRKLSNLLSFYLAQEGYVPVQHHTGAGAVERVLELKPAFITLDLRLPELDGWEVIRALKSNPHTLDIPVLVISAVQDGEMALNLGAEGYLLKPIHRSDVQRLLNRMEIPKPDGRKARVLIVDDDRQVIELLNEMLPDDHYEILTARDGRQGFKQASDAHPDMIVLDLMMPGSSGFEMVEKLRDNPETANVPVIVLTAMNVTPEQRRFLTENTQGILLKTRLTPQALLGELRRLESNN